MSCNVRNVTSSNMHPGVLLFVVYILIILPTCTIYIVNIINISGVEKRLQSISDAGFVSIAGEVRRWFCIHQQCCLPGVARHQSVFLLQVSISQKLLYNTLHYNIVSDIIEFIVAWFWQDFKLEATKCCVQTNMYRLSDNKYFPVFHRKRVLTFHANCLLRRGCMEY